MSSDVCATCKNRTSCTYPHNQVIVQCEEYEYAEPVRDPEAAAKAATARDRREPIHA